MPGLHGYTSESTVVNSKVVQTANSSPGSLSMIFTESSLLTQIYALVAGNRITIDRNVNGRMTIAVDLSGLSSADISDFQAAVSGNTDVAANTAARHTHANKTTLDKFSETGTTLFFDGKALTYENFFIGQGQDGNVTISVDTTLTRDMYYDTLVVNAGIRLNANGFRVFCKTSATINGILSNNASNAVGQTAGLGSPAGSLKGGVPGQNGQNSVSGAIPATPGLTASNGTNVSHGLGVNGSGGGKGGDTNGFGANSIASGGSATTGGTRTLAINPPKTLYDFMTFVDANFSVDNQQAYFNSSAGAGGGSSGAAYGTPATSGVGGGGGGAGGFVFLFARTITIGASGIIECNGGNGANGGNASGGTGGQTAGGGGGGASGSGGCPILIYNTLVNNGSIRALPGSPGSGGTPLLFTGIGATPGNSGSSGLSGTIYQYQYS